MQNTTKYWSIIAGIFYIYIANIKICDLVEFFLDSKIASKNYIRLTHIHDRFIKDKWYIKTLEVIFYIKGKLKP